MTRLSMNRPSPGLRPPSPRLAGRGQGEGCRSGSWPRLTSKFWRCSLSMNQWGETPSSPDLQWIQIRARRSLALPVYAPVRSLPTSRQRATPRSEANAAPFSNGQQRTGSQLSAKLKTVGDGQQDGFDAFVPGEFAIQPVDGAAARLFDSSRSQATAP